MKFLTLIFVLLSLPIFAIQEKGYRGLSSIDRDFRFSSRKIKRDNLSHYISSRILHAKKLGFSYFRGWSLEKIQLEAKEIATLILTTSNVFKIEASILTSLIEKESLFAAKAKSRTGAAGLTQMVGFGIEEVFHQLGLVENEADFVAVQTFRRYYEQVMFAVHFWHTLPNLYKLEQFSSLRYFERNEIKKILYQNKPLSIVFGAVLYKTLLATACKSSYCVNRIASDSLYAEKVYEAALIRYNGDNTSISHCKYDLPFNRLQLKYCYAKDVIKKASNIRKSAKL